MLDGCHQTSRNPKFVCSPNPIMQPSSYPTTSANCEMSQHGELNSHKGCVLAAVWSDPASHDRFQFHSLNVPPILQLSKRTYHRTTESFAFCCSLRCFRSLCSSSSTRRGSSCNKHSEPEPEPEPRSHESKTKNKTTTTTNK